MHLRKRHNSEFKPLAEAAQITKIRARKIRKLVEAGKCPGYYSGNRIIVNVPGLVALLASQTSAEATDHNKKGGDIVGTSKRAAPGLHSRYRSRTA